MRWLMILACILTTVCGCSGKGIEVRAGDAREGVLRSPEVQAEAAPPEEGSSLLSPANLGVWLEDRDWDFRSWVGDFQEALYRNWEAPYAYRLGLISGSTKLRLEIARDGTLAGLEVVQEEGHPSFTAYSRESVVKTFPVPPLPEDFQGEGLTMTLLLDYPLIR
ncbi:MAG: hypothetical protein AB7V45_01665 [Candidatus Krumholzibacteriia bacterium]